MSWCDYCEIPPSGALDEFDRKTVRNDYPLMALWEMGIKKLRVPFTDLNNALTRLRMRELQRQGREFTLFSYGIPGMQQIERVNKYAALLENWEIGFIESELDQLVSTICDIKEVNYYFSPIKDTSEPDHGGTYYHTIQHGFSSGDHDLINFLVDICESHSIEPGLVFRVRMKDRFKATINQFLNLADEYDNRISVHLISSDPNPATELTDATQFEAGIEHAFELARIHPQINFFIDIFADMDRGYFVRNGFVDRRYNPNRAALLVKFLQQSSLTH
jgi:hypothetical protein